MELELKHLVAYLPYGLKVEYSLPEWQQKQIDKIAMLSSSHSRVYIESYNFNGWVEKFKPILRPLSALVIDENLIEDFIGLGNWCNAYDEYIDHWYPDSSYAKQAPYVIFEYFLVNHYDVFGLIEKWLAVDVNSLNVD